MANTDYNRRFVDIRDFNSQRGGLSLTSNVFRILSALKEKFLRGSESSSIESWVYIRPVGDNLHQLKSPRDPSKIIKATGRVSFIADQRVSVAITRAGVTILGEPPSGEVGKSQFPELVDSSSLDLFAIESMVPYELPIGGVTSVQFFGFGFASVPLDIVKSKIFDAPTETNPTGDFTFKWKDDVEVEISDLEFVSDTELEAIIVASNNIEPGRPFNGEILRGT